MPRIDQTTASDRLSPEGMRERDLSRTEASIVRGELAITCQRRVIEGTGKAGWDTGSHLRLLASMERNLAHLHAWRQHLLDERT